MNKYWAGSPNYNGGNNGRLFLFPHWTAGGFDGSVSTLQNPNVQASAHYVIEGDRVAQLVSEDNTTWHCYNSWYNWRSISYEMVGWPGNPPSQATLDTTAELMAQASWDYFGGAALVLGENVLLHNMVYNTSCPGESDINYLIAKANQIIGHGGNPEPAPTPEPGGGDTDFQGGTYVCNVDELNVRDAPGLNSNVVASYNRGQTVNLDSWYTVTDGYVWGRYTAYSGATRYVGVGPHTGTADAGDFLVLAGSGGGAPSGGGGGSVEARGYTVVVPVLNVRSAPSMNAELVAQYADGQVIYMDGGSTAAEGYLWGSYLGSSGNTRWVAMGPLDGSQSYLV